MKDPISEKQELEFSERFDRGKQPTNDPREHSVFAGYERIRQGLQGYTLPPLDLPALERRLQAEMRSLTASQKKSGWKWIWILKPAMAALALFLIFVAGLEIVKSRIKENPVQQIEWISQADCTPQKVSPLWLRRLQGGKMVQVPAGVFAQMRLCDGSKLTCTADSELSIRIGNERCITLLSGAISVEAKPNIRRRMIVKTPLLDVVVTGTVFHVEVVK